MQTLHVPSSLAASHLHNQFESLPMAEQEASLFREFIIAPLEKVLSRLL
jgi:hypothetical protein